MDPSAVAHAPVPPKAWFLGYGVGGVMRYRPWCAAGARAPGREIADAVDWTFGCVPACPRASTPHCCSTARAGTSPPISSFAPISACSCCRRRAGDQSARADLAVPVRALPRAPPISRPRRKQRGPLRSLEPPRRPTTPTESRSELHQPEIGHPLERRPPRPLAAARSPRTLQVGRHRRLHATPQRRPPYRPAMMRRSA